MTRPMTYYVYIHKRLDSLDPFYVGKGTGKRAWLKAGRNEYWQRVASKHGYEVEIVAEFEEPSAALTAELEVMLFLERWGYSLTNKALGGGGITGYKHTDEARAKMSRRMKEVCGREDHRRMRSEAQKARFLDESYRQHMSQKAKDRWQREEYRQRMEEIAKTRYTEQSRERIGRAAKAKWADAEYRESRSRTNHHCARSVECVETGMKFDLLIDAAEWLRQQGHTNAKAQSISNVLSGRRKTVYGYTWR